MFKIFFMIDEVPGTVSRVTSLNRPSMMVLTEEQLEQHERINNSIP